MKILFTFGGIPHYLDALLNKLSSKSLDITVVTPQSGTATIGQGVKLVALFFTSIFSTFIAQSNQEVSYKICYS